MDKMLLGNQKDGELKMDEEQEKFEPMYNQRSPSIKSQVVVVSTAQKRRTIVPEHQKISETRTNNNNKKKDASHMH